MARTEQASTDDDHRRAKMVVYDDANIEPVRIFDSGVVVPDPETFGEYKLTYRTGDIVSPRVEVSEPLLLEMADFFPPFATEVRPDPQPRSGSKSYG